MNFPLLRPMTEDDLHAVLAVQAVCYPPSMQEPRGVLLERLRAAPATTLAACDAEGVCAYVFAYPSRLARITPLHAGFAPAHDADTLYVHDLAVHPRAHGQGLGRRLALLDASAFWERLGFAGAAPGQGGDALASYPAGALYMTRFLDG
jgi:ribosomal protein S18 acetylase RimI-like enzyme